MVSLVYTRQSVNVESLANKIYLELKNLTIGEKNERASKEKAEWKMIGEEEKREEEEKTRRRRRRRRRSKRRRNKRRKKRRSRKWKEEEEEEEEEEDK